MEGPHRAKDACGPIFDRPFVLYCSEKGGPLAGEPTHSSPEGRVASSVPLRDDAPSPPSHLLITRFDLEIEIRFVRFACLTVAVLCAGCAFAADEPLPAEPCSSSQGEMPTSMRPSSDDKTGITWYYERTTTTRFNEDAFYLYAGRKACEVWLRLRIQYVTDKPLGITHIQVRADDRTFDLPEPHVKHDSDGKLLWEWYDEQVGPDHLLMLFKVVASKSAAVRFTGSSRSAERLISDAEKEAIKTVFGAYHTLGGKL